VPDYLHEIFGYNPNFSPEVRYKNETIANVRKGISEMNVNNKTTHTSK
jgi:hypothetical protein